MNDLIRRSESIEELEKYEKELRKDKVEAIETDDENMLFAIANQLTAICRIKRNIMNMSTAYSVEKVVAELEERTDFLKGCTKYGNKNAKQQDKSYDTMMMYEVADLVDDLIEIVKHGGVGKET